MCDTGPGEPARGWVDAHSMGEGLGSSGMIATKGRPYGLQGRSHMSLTPEKLRYVQHAMAD